MGYIFAILDHTASIVTLFSFPLVLAGLIAMFSSSRTLRETSQSGRIGLRTIGIVFLIVGGLAYVVDIGDRFGWWRYQPQLEIVAGQTFKNQTVLVDGKDFINCTFDNTTLEFEGGGFEFQNPRFIGDQQFRSNTKLIGATMGFLIALDGMGAFASHHLPQQ